MRQLILFGIVIVAVAALLLWPRPSAIQVESPQLSYVTTAHQLGVVGYRDPAGAISPDGKLFAYAEGRFIRVIPIGGGAPATLASGEGQIRYLTWSANDTIVAEDATPTARWWTYRVGTLERQPLWGGTPLAVQTLRQLAWSADGKWAAALATTKEGTEVWRIAADASTTTSSESRGERRFQHSRPPARSPASSMRG